MATVAAGRLAMGAQVRARATRVDETPARRFAAEVLMLIEPTLDDLRRQAALALERAPSEK
jgi:hypothetical protein